MTTDPRVEALAAALGAPAADLAVVRAPGRVNLIGEHTDYNDGFVLPLAIDRETLVARRPRADGRVVARSADLPGEVDLPADGGATARTVEPAWGRFVAGVLATAGGAGDGLDLAIASTVPAGAGLSSSSALSVALTLAVAAANGRAPAARDAARAALAAEVLATGVPGGLMDQLCSLLGVAGHAVLIDCRDLSARPVPLPEHLAVLVVHSGVPRTLAGSAYAERRAACDAAAARLGLRALRDATAAQVADDPIARHVVSEDARVLEFVAALEAHDDATLGALLLASHASLRDDFRVSIPELDVLVDVLVAHGALGARLTGAGFGGCVVALVPRERVDACAAAATAEYAARTGRSPQAFVVRATDGAGPLRADEDHRAGGTP